MFNRLFLIFAISVGVVVNSVAQNFSDSLFRQKQIDNTIQFYNHSIGLQAHLYNGPLYANYPRLFTEGHQYFQSHLSTIGSVAYDGLEYYHIPMMYDIIRDELIIFYPQGNLPVNLIKGKVDSFSLFGHSFIHLRKDAQQALPDNGYYDKLYSSSFISFFVKRRKEMQEVGGSSTIETRVYAKTGYYLLKEGIYYIIKNRNSVLDLMRNKRSQIQQYLRKNNLRFKKNLESDILSTVTYYDQLMKTRQ